MYRTERIWVDYNETMSHLCHLAKNLYNEANYIVRQEFINNGKWIRYNDLYHMLKNSENFRGLPAHTAQHVLQQVDKNWKAFFKSIKEWKKNPEKFSGRPKLPKYLPKNGEFQIRFDYQQCKIRDGKLRFPKKTKLKEVIVREGIKKLKEARIVPMGVGYWLEIVYKKKATPRKLDRSRAIAVDIGVRNLVTIADNIGGRPIVIKGGVVCSVNQYYNKRKAELQSIYAKQGLKHTPKRLKRMSVKRMNKLRDYMHKTTRWIINYCMENNISTIIIGHNAGWKQGVNLGRRNNQKFVTIPFDMLIHQLQYKGEEAGINVVLIDEAHTSKCSFLDNEPVEHREKYIGKRIKRGLFRSAKGIIINADVNACYNLLRKAKAILKGLAKVNLDGIEGVGLHPVRVNSLSRMEVVT
ncbi:MAG: RNA-guided endonuclease InsQ/TnpB family protein [Candidatus Syntropharchaeia archaeon]